MKRFILLILLISVGLLSGKILSLDEAVNIALDNSQESKLNLIDLNKVQSSYKSTLWDIAPDGSISYNWTRSSGITSEGAGLSISKSIASTLPDYFNWKNAKHNIKMANINSQQTQKDIAWQVLNSYIDLLLSQKKLEIYQENYEVQLKLLNETELKKELGKSTDYEYNQVEINTLNSQLTLLDAQKTIDEKISNFLLILNIEADTLSLEDIDINIAPEYNYDLDKEKSYSILKSQLNIDHNEFLLIQDKLRFLPDLTFSWSYGSSSINNEPFEFDNYQDGSTWRMSLSYPLFNFFKQGQVHYRNKENLYSERINLEHQINQFKTDYNNLLSDLDNLFIRNEINDRILSQAQENFEIAKTNFSLGLIKSIELEQSKTDLREAELNNIDIEYQVFLKQQAINHLLSKKIANKW